MPVELEKIIAVSGKGGLFRLLNSGKSAIIAESLVDGKKIPVMSTAKVSTLSDISIFCLEEDVPLRKVLLSMKELYGDKPEPDPKGDSKLLKSTMKKILPHYDAERVYDSDIRKLFLWFSILKSRDMLDFAEPEKEAEEAPAETPDHEENVL
jgi:hypothetical protein